MAVRRAAFESSGGLLTLSHHLADDFLLGRAVVASGYRMEYSEVVVDSIPDHCTVAEQFTHLVRWSRTIRVCNPPGYLGSVMLHGIALLALYALVAPERAFPLACLAALAAIRTAGVGWIHFAYLGNREILKQLPLLPLSDLVQAAAWVAGLRSRSVLWRGESYSITSGGRLVPVKQKADTVHATAA
jgi:ceramide glucosyltransferase